MWLKVFALNLWTKKSICFLLAYLNNYLHSQPPLPGNRIGFVREREFLSARRSLPAHLILRSYMTSINDTCDYFLALYVYFSRLLARRHRRERLGNTLERPASGELSDFRAIESRDQLTFWKMPIYRNSQYLTTRVTLEYKSGLPRP